MNVFKLDDNDNRTKARQHPVSAILKRPYKHLTSYQFRFTMQALLELRGNAFAQIIRDSVTNRPIELRIIKPSAVQAEENEDGVILYCFYDSKTGKRIKVPYFNMIHLRNFSCDSDGVIGLSPILMGRENLALAVAAQEFEAAFFGNGAHVGGVFTFPGILSKEQKVTFVQVLKRIIQD